MHFGKTPYHTHRKFFAVDLVIVLCMFTLADESAAETWQEYYVLMPPGNRLLIDIDGIKRVANHEDLIDVATKNIYPRADKIGATNSKARYLVDCDSKLVVQYQWEAFDDQDRKMDRSLQYPSRSDAIAYVENNKATANPSQRSLTESYIKLCQAVWLLVSENKVATETGSGASIPHKTNLSTPSLANHSISIPLRQRGGVFEVMANVNSEVKVYFVVDSGASDVTISEGLARLLVDNGSISTGDIVGNQSYRFANGASSSGVVVNLRSIELEGHVIRNVRAVVMKGENVPLLLGQSALKQLGNWTIDTKKRTLDITLR